MAYTERLRRLEENTHHQIDQAEPLETKSAFESYALICLILCYIAAIIALALECGSLIAAILVTSLLLPLLFPFLMIPAVAGAVCLMVVFWFIRLFRNPRPEPLDWSERMD